MIREEFLAEISVHELVFLDDVGIAEALLDQHPRIDFYEAVGDDIHEMLDSLKYEAISLDVGTQLMVFRCSAPEPESEGWRSEEPDSEDGADANEDSTDTEATETSEDGESAALEDVSETEPMNPGVLLASLVLRP